MTTEAMTARNRIVTLERELASAKANLSHLEFACSHAFGSPVSDPIIRKGYTEPGDAPGTMGIDHRSSFYVPEERTPRWTRTCGLCGKVEETRETTKEVSESPTFR